VPFVARAGLTRALVVEEAAVAADHMGLDRLTLAAVAERCGVRLPSLYKHIDSLDGLRRDLAVLSTRQLADALAGAAVGKARGDALQALAAAYRDYATRHPGRYAATVRAPVPDDAEHQAVTDAVLRVVLAVLAGYGLTGDDALDATRALRAALHGFVGLETGGGFGLPLDVDRSFERLVRGLDDLLGRWVDVAG
jgi:AcrR family transcriptional regulator